MTPKLSRIWIADNRTTTLHIAGEYLAIRVDFDNDRHYESRVAHPYDQKAVASALHAMAGMIGHDPLLEKK